MKIRLWRGYHSPSLREEIRATWDAEELLILCPPHLETFEFVEHLPQGQVSLIGEWEKITLPQEFELSRGPEYSARPVLGVFTSGTVSGRPRLILYTKENINASLDAIYELFDPLRVTTLFCYAQPFHTFGLLLGYVLSLKKNLNLITPDGKYSRESHFKRLAVGDSTVITLGTPAHFYDLISLVKETGASVAPTYSSIMGGASVSTRLWHETRDILKIEAPSIGYGCTEAAPGITHLSPGIEPKEDAEVGVFLKNLDSLLKPDAVEIQGASLCLAIIDAGGVNFPKSCDIRDRLRQRSDGILVYEGRSDLTLNRGGQKISLEDLERSALSATGLEIIAVPIRDERLSEDLAVMIRQDLSVLSTRESLHSSSVSSSDEFETFAYQRLADHFLKQNGIRLCHENIAVCADFPRNASHKPCRRLIRVKIESVQLSTDSVCYPVPTSQLSKWLPHRPPMVWIDEVCRASADGGEARLRIKMSGHYMTDRKLRASAVVELIAQASGFIAVCKRLDDLAKTGIAAPKVSKAFLVGVRAADFTKLNARASWSEGDALLVRIGNIKDFGPMQVLDGTVLLEETGEVLGSANLKLYAE